MTSPELLYQRDRRLRKRARAVLDEQVERVKGDLAARSIGARAAHGVAEEARLAADAGVSLARERKGALLGTIAALAVWHFRDPIMRQIKKLTTRMPAEADREEPNQGGSDNE